MSEYMPVNEHTLKVVLGLPQFPRLPPVSDEMIISALAMFQITNWQAISAWLMSDDRADFLGVLNDLDTNKHRKPH